MTLPSVPNHLFQTGPLALQMPPGGGADRPGRRRHSPSVDGITNVPVRIRRHRDGSRRQRPEPGRFDPDRCSAPGYAGPVGRSILRGCRPVAGLNLDPIKMTGSARVHLGAVANDTNAFTRHAGHLPTHLSQTGRPTGWSTASGSFITDGTKVVTLELDLNGSVLPGNAAVNVCRRQHPAPDRQRDHLRDQPGGAGTGPAGPGRRVDPCRRHGAARLGYDQYPGDHQLGTGGAIPDGQAFFVTEARSPSGSSTTRTAW